MSGGGRTPADLPIRPPSRFRFALIAVLVPAVLFTLVIWLQAEYQHAETIRWQAERSFNRRSDQIALLGALDDAETVQRGYLLTGDRAFFDAYLADRRQIMQQLAVAASIHDPDVPPAYLPTVSRLAAQKLAGLDRSIALYRAGDTSGARRLVSAQPTRRTSDTLHAVIRRMIDAEKQRSAAHTAAFMRYRIWLQAVVYITVGIVLLTSYGILLILWRLRQQRYAAVVHALEIAEGHAALLDSTTDPILILAADGTIETVNGAATRMLGYPPGDLVGRDIAVILGLEPGSFPRRVGLAAGHLRRSLLVDETIRHRDGHGIPVDIVIGAMNGGRGDRIVLSLRDIAERDRVDRVKDELISTVSHELRTPLTSIVGSLGLLRAGVAGEMPPQAAHLVDIAQTNSQRLIRLINDMLDIDRIESAELQMADVPVDVRSVIDEACLGSEGLALAQDVVLECSYLDDPVVVIGDESRLVQVVTNLLSNAIRVSPQGSVIGMTLKTEAGRAVLAIEDRGPGVPASFRDRIFGRFERAAADDGGSGTGLGLAISREIVVRHHGSIWFEDREGGGTRFLVSLPLASDAVQSVGQRGVPLSGKADCPSAPL